MYAFNHDLFYPLLWIIHPCLNSFQKIGDHLIQGILATLSGINRLRIGQSLLTLKPFNHLINLNSMVQDLFNKSSGDIAKGQPQNSFCLISHFDQLFDDEW